jgi:hypothetical protein
LLLPHLGHIGSQLTPFLKGYLLLEEHSGGFDSSTITTKQIYQQRNKL